MKFYQAVKEGPSTNSSSHARPNVISVLYFCLCTVFYSRAFSFVLQPLGAFYILLVMITALSSFYMLASGERAKYFAFPVLGLLMPIFLSAAWSGDIYFTIYYCSLTSLIVISGVICGFILPPNSFDQLLRTMLRWFVICSLVAYFAGVGFMVQGDGLEQRTAFAGILGHKSAAGYVFALSGVVELISLLSHKRKGTSAILLLVCCFLLYVSESRAAQALFAFNGILALTQQAISTKCFERMCKLFGYVLLIAFLIVAPLVTWVGSSFDENFVKTTGRSFIWEYTETNIIDKFPSGFGYLSFFGFDQQEPAYLGPGALGFPGKYYVPPHAHNSVLELSVDCGALGVIVICSLLAMLIRLLRVNSANVRTGGDMRHFAYFSFCVIPSIVDLWLMAHFGLATFLLVAVASRSGITSERKEKRG